MEITATEMKEQARFNELIGVVNSPNQDIVKILELNGMTKEAQQLRKTMSMLSHVFHKSNYPQYYDGDKQIF